jgi:hypothetical protein
MVIAKQQTIAQEIITVLGVFDLKINIENCFTPANLKI